ncbi:MAG: hypothetical protein DI566_12240 [Microbacterium sp.]|nr:MAG: hypothetical protein DI566_12240 [Microbacterium sp.]
MTNRRRVAALAAAIGLAAAALTGCSGGGGTSPTASSDEPVTITLWTWGAGLEEQAALYEKEHPNVTVEFVNAGVGSVQFEKVRNALKAGSGAPDAFFVGASIIPSFVATDSVVDLNTYGAQDLKDDHIASAWDTGDINGGHYFYPLGWGPYMYFYRADVFEKYGIDVPTTWDEFAAAAEKLHTADPTMYLANFPSLDVNWFGVLQQAGSQPFTTDGTTVAVNWDNDETQKVAAYWQDLLDRDLVARVADFTPEWNQAVANGQFASFTGGTWYTPLIEAAAPDQSGQWRAALLPQWNEGDNASAEAGLAGFAITKQSQHPAETEAFIRWLSSSEESVKLLYAQGNFPTFKPVLESDEVQNQKWPFFGDQQLAQIFLKSGEGITPVDPGPFADVAQAKQIEAVGLALQNQTTLPKAMSQMQEDLVAYAKDQGYTVK